MGIPIDPDGWEVGTELPCVQDINPPLWPEGQTPRYVWATFSILDLCDEVDCEFDPPLDINLTVMMEQQAPSQPGRWLGTSGVLSAIWQPCATCVLKLTHGSGVPLFHATSIPGTTWFANQLICGDDFTCGENGIACVTWCPGAHKLLFDYNLAAFDGINMEFGPAAGGYMFYRFAQQQVPMNVLVKYVHLLQA